MFYLIYNFTTDLLFNHVFIMIFFIQNQISDLIFFKLHIKLLYKYYRRLILIAFQVIFFSDNILFYYKLSILFYKHSI